MNFYILPAAVALIANLFVLVIARRAGVRTDYLYSLIVTFAAHNICELLLFLNHAESNGLTVYILSAYYATTFGLVAAACSCALKVAEIPKDSIARKLENLVWVAAGAGVILSLFTNQIVNGVAELSYSSTAIKGNSYWLFQVTAAISALFSITALIYGFFIAADKRQKVRCLSMLGAYIPLVVGALTILSLMTAGFKVNATGVLPIATALFICILVYSERRHRLTDIRRVVPGTHENKVTLELQEAFAKYAAGEVGYQDSTNKIESLLLEYSYEKHSGNVLQTAKFMKVGRSTLYKKMQKHNLGRQNKSKDKNSVQSAVND